MDNETKKIVCPECGSTEIGKKSNGCSFCKNCGADVIVAVCPECGGFDIGKKFDGGFFCRNCGSEVAACRQCGSFDIKKGSDGVLFCRNCGAKKNATSVGKDAVLGSATVGLSSIRSVTEKVGAAAKSATSASAGKGFVDRNEAKDSERTGSNGKKTLLKPLFIIEAIILVVIILTIVLVPTKCSLENEWAFGVNTYKFNDDGTFSASVNTLNNNGTYLVDGDKITLQYSFMGVMEKETELTYSISGKTLTLSGDVTLTGAGSVSMDYECTSSNGSFALIILVIVEVVASVLFFVAFFKKKKKHE